VLASWPPIRSRKSNLACTLGENEIYARMKSTGMDMAELGARRDRLQGADRQGQDSSEKLALAHKLATRRLAHGVQPELDACFAALALEPALA
jgi:hypothetical protein